MPAFGLNDCSMDLGGRQLTGFGENDAIAWKRTSDRFDMVDTADGDSIANRIESKRGEITITARYDSPINRTLYQLAEAASSFGFSCTLPNGDVIESPDCRVMKYPEPSVGKKTSDYVWVITATPLRTPYAIGT